MCFYFLLQKIKNKNGTKAEVISGCLNAGTDCWGVGKHLPMVYSDRHFQLMAFLLDAVQAVRIMLGYEVQEGLGRWP